MASQNTGSYLLPRIPGIEALFACPLFSLLNTPPDQYPPIGFRRKSSVVIEGPPGSGKTAATLALCRALMPDPVEHLYYLSTEVTSERLFKNHSEFGWFAQASPEGRWAASIPPFEDKNLFFVDIPRARTDRPLPSSTDLINEIFRAISADRRTPTRQKGSALVIVDSLSGLLRDAASPGDRRRLTEDFLERLESEFGDDQAIVFLVTESPSLERNEPLLEQYVADYVFRLGHKNVAGGRRLRTWEVVKSHGTYMEAGKHTWDFFTEANEKAIFQDEELRDFVWKYESRHKQARPGVLAPNQRKPATIVVYPQWATYMKDSSEKVLPEKNPTTKTVKIWSGTPGLDELLSGDSEYWSRPDKWVQTRKGARWTPGLHRGETTLLLGASGTMKTWLSIQFLAGNLHADGFCKMTKPKVDMYQSALKKVKKLDGGELECKNRAKRLAFYNSTLLISFEGESSDVERYLRTSKDLETLSPSFMYRSPVSLHLNHLLFEIAWTCRNRKVERVAIDGLSDMLKCIDTKDRAGATAALLRVVGGALTGTREKATVFVTFELPPETNDQSSAPDGISAICDNVIMLKQIRLNDQMHKAVFVLKARSRRHDNQVREVVMNPRDTGETPGVRIQSGFEGFSDILSGSPQKAQVALQLFRENQDEADFNQKLCSRIASAFSFHPALHAFTHSELSQFLDGARGVLGQVPATDIKVITLDEWWLRDLQRPLLLPKTQERDAESPPPALLRVDGFFSLKELEQEDVELFALQQQRSTSGNQALASEHWITEVEKGVTTTLVKESEIESTIETLLSSDCNLDKVNLKESLTIDTQLQAMPNYMDVGMFCVNRNHEAKNSLFSSSAFDSYASLDRQIPRLWAIPKLIDNYSWFQLGNIANVAGNFETIADLLFQATISGTRPSSGFSFDMARGETTVCFFMELVWSFGVEEGFLSEAALDFANHDGNVEACGDQCNAMRSAFRLLQFLVYHGLMSPFPSNHTGHDAVFSRQWYSTLNISGEINDLGDVGLSLSTPLPEKSAQKARKRGSSPTSTIDSHKDVSDMVPIPFFPVGMLPQDIDHGPIRLVLAEMSDIRKHLSGILHRIEAALDWIEEYRNRIAENAKNIPLANKTLFSLANDVSNIRKHFIEIRERVIALRNRLQSLTEDPQLVNLQLLKAIHEEMESLSSTLLRHATDPRWGLASRQLRWEQWVSTFEPGAELKEVIRSLLSAQKESIDKRQTIKQRIEQDLAEWRCKQVTKMPWTAAGMAMDSRDIRQMIAWLTVRLDQMKVELETLEKCSVKVPSAIQGFACSGSWMLGVLRNTHSPGLSWKLIEELTTRESNRLRAESGAGIPTRKDFYDFFGKLPVPRLSSRFTVSWKRFLDVIGAKVRRRDRAVCRHVQLSNLSPYLRDQIIRCINAARDARERCLKRNGSVESWGEPPTTSDLMDMSEAVNKATKNILLYVANEQRKAGGKFARDRCELCPKAYRRESGTGCGLAEKV